MLRFWWFERMDKNPWQSICPEVGQMVAALPTRFPRGEIWKSAPGAWNQQKSPSAAALRVFAEKLRTESLKLCHIHSLWLLALPWAHSIPSARGHDLHLLLQRQLCTKPKVSLPEQQWNSTFLLNIHRILLFSKHISMSISTSKIAENIDTGCQSGLQNCPQKISIKSITCFFTCTAIILQAFTCVILNFI